MDALDHGQHLPRLWISNRFKNGSEHITYVNTLVR